jgi:site-specific DNA recombinase
MNVALYARVSTEKQEKQETVESQLDALREFAREKGYALVNEYVDKGYSGEMLDRPSLDKLRDDAGKKAFESVLVHSPDRLARKYVYQELIKIELKKHGVNIIFLNHPDSGEGPEDNLLEGVQGLIAEYEKAKILERTRRGRLYKARKGLIVTSIAPYGYVYVRKNAEAGREGYYVINEREYRIVELIFDLFVNRRLSKRGIARELTTRGIKPRRGIHWRTSSIDKILRNETYTGLTHYNKHFAVEASRKTKAYRRRKNSSLRLRPREQWIPIKLPEELRIIDNEIFYAAQERLRKNSQLLPRESKHRYLLKGLLECGQCGSPYVSSPCHGKLYYRCGNRYRKFPLPRECKAGTVKADKLENLVWQTISEALQNPDIVVEQIKKYHEDLNADSWKLEQEAKKIDDELLKVKDSRDRLLDAYAEGAVNLRELKEQMEKSREKETFLLNDRRKLAEQLSQLISPEEIKRNIQDYCQAVKPHLPTLSFEEKKQILNVLVNRIILEQDGTVRIKAIIPVKKEEQRIVDTSSGCCGLRQQLLRWPFLPGTGP